VTEIVKTDQQWTVRTTGAGEIILRSTNGPHSTPFHMTTDSLRSGVASLCEATISADLSGLGISLFFFFFSLFVCFDECD
jgi:hypothetical protein